LLGRPYYRHGAPNGARSVPGEMSLGLGRGNSLCPEAKRPGAPGDRAAVRRWGNSAASVELRWCTLVHPLLNPCLSLVYPLFIPCFAYPLAPALPPLYPRLPRLRASPEVAGISALVSRPFSCCQALPDTRGTSGGTWCLLNTTLSGPFSVVKSDSAVPAPRFHLTAHPRPGL
jgi:hypothetical protein